MATFSQIIQRVYLNIGTDDEVTWVAWVYWAYDKTLIVKPRINECIRQILIWQKKNLLTDRMIMGGDIRFMRKKLPFTVAPSRPITVNVAVWATSIYFNTADWNPLGYWIINWQIFYYTGKQPDRLTWVQGITMTHSKGDHVESVYTRPTDAHKPFALIPTDWTNERKSIDYMDFRYTDRQVSYYTSMQDDMGVVTGHGKQHIYVRYPCAEKTRFRYHYYKKPNTLVNDNDICEIPDDSYCTEMITAIVAGELMREREQSEQAQMLLKIGYAKLEEFYHEYSKQNKDRDEKIKRRKQIRNHYFTSRWSRYV